MEDKRPCARGTCACRGIAARHSDIIAATDSDINAATGSNIIAASDSDNVAATLESRLGH
jgi:hypothetical protein